MWDRAETKQPWPNAGHSGPPIVRGNVASTVFTTKEATYIDSTNVSSDFSAPSISPLVRSASTAPLTRYAFLKFKSPFVIPTGDTGMFVFKECPFFASATYINIDTAGMKLNVAFNINPVSSFGGLTMATLNWNTQGSVSLLSTSFTPASNHVRRASLGGTYASASGTPVLRLGSLSPDLQRDALVIPYPSAVTMEGLRLSIVFTADLSARVSSRAADFTIPRDFATGWVSGFYYYLASKFPPRP